MAKIRNMGDGASKWAAVTSSRTAEYQLGVMNPRTPWASATANAAGAYEEGVKAAITNKSFAKGVAAAGNDKWQQATLDKGPARFAEGVSMGQAAYQAGFEPYAQTIENTQLPQRFARGDPRNLKRVEAIASALNKRRLSMK